MEEQREGITRDEWERDISELMLKVKKLQTEKKELVEAIDSFLNDAKYGHTASIRNSEKRLENLVKKHKYNRR